jgi:hypothetical protein
VGCECTSRSAGLSWWSRQGCGDGRGLGVPTPLSVWGDSRMEGGGVQMQRSAFGIPASEK